MDQYLNWVTLLGVGLIAIGFGLLGVALNAAKSFVPARHRRGTELPSARRPRTGSDEKVAVSGVPRASRPPR